MDTKPPIIQPQRSTQSSRVWLWVAVNLLAFPGLGTVMAKRRWGYCQMAVMLVGFGLVTGFFLWFIVGIFQLWQTGNEAAWRAHYHRAAWAWQSGLILCAVAWIGSLISSLQMLKDEGKGSRPF